MLAVKIAVGVAAGILLVLLPLVVIGNIVEDDARTDCLVESADDAIAGYPSGDCDGDLNGWLP